MTLSVSPTHQNMNQHLGVVPRMLAAAPIAWQLATSYNFHPRMQVMHVDFASRIVVFSIGVGRVRFGSQKVGPFF
jgi:hypothetical protein